MAKNRIPVTFNAPLESVDDLESWLRNSRMSGTFYHREQVNADGTPVRWRVNGQLKRWKTDRNRMRLPIKHGLYDYDAIDSLEEFNRYLSTGYEVTEQKS